MTDCVCSNFPASLGNVTIGAALGIGITPTQKLDTAGTIRARDGAGADQGVELIHGGGVGNVFAYNRGAGSGYMPLRLDATTLIMNTMPGTGSVGIGTATPGTGGTPSKLVVVAQTNTANHTGQADLIDSLSLAANRGGLINFGGVYDSNGTITTWAGIQGAKANANNNDVQGQLRFFTRPAGGVNTERMRIDELGHVGIATTAPTQTLDTQGTIRARDGAGADQGVELIYGGGIGNVIAYNRGAGSGYMPLRLDATTLVINTGPGTGSVGIGVSPGTQTKLDTLGTVRARDGAGTDQGVELIYSGGAGNSGVGNVIAYERTQGNSGYRTLRLDGSTISLNLNSPGNVGIGLAVPQQKLDVAGNIQASGLVIAGSNVNAGTDVNVGHNLSVTNDATVDQDLWVKSGIRAGDAPSKLQARKIADGRGCLYA